MTQVSMGMRDGIFSASALDKRMDSVAVSYDYQKVETQLIVKDLVEDRKTINDC